MNNEIKSFYRIYRPKTFSDVYGQTHITQTLINQIKNNKIGHAYLFCGTRGTGKTSVAKIFANAINCSNFVNGKVCGKCEWCKSPNKNLDVLEIDAASNNGVDAVRDLCEAVKYPPVFGRYKVYIIDEVHMFSGSAFNALLKTLEEPPSYVVFILATTEAHKLLATVQSRCLRFDFRNVAAKDLTSIITKIFTKEKITAEDGVIERIAREGRGSVRDALSFADMAAAYCGGKKITNADIDAIIGELSKDVFMQLITAMMANKPADIHNLCTKLFDNCNNTNRIVINMLAVIKEEYIKTPVKKLAYALQKFCEIELLLKNSGDAREYFETVALLAAGYEG
jgi:DNA polymerase-3 subunit gamma/tau